MNAFKKLRVLIPGGSGQVGRMLARHFDSQGHTVTVLSRTPRAEKWRTARWDGVTAEAIREALGESDVCINLIGRSVDCRYNAENRRQILESRTRSTAALNQAIALLDRAPQVWINASTATIYRHALDRPMDEASGELGGKEPGVPETWTFSIEVAKAWEAAFFSTPTPRTRGGVFDVLSGLVRWGLGGRQGSGEQYVSWIHEADFVRVIDLLIARDDICGVVNVASPHPLPNRDFMRALREAWGVRMGLATPEWMVEVGAVALRTESELILKSRRVVPGRLTAEGFQFLFPEWPEAARDLVERWRAGRGFQRS